MKKEDFFENVSYNRYSLSENQVSMIPYQTKKIRVLL